MEILRVGKPNDFLLYLEYKLLSTVIRELYYVMISQLTLRITPTEVLTMHLPGVLHRDLLTPAISTHVLLTPAFNRAALSLTPRSLCGMRGGELALFPGMKATFCLREQTFLMLHIDSKITYAANLGHPLHPPPTTPPLPASLNSFHQWV